MIKNLEHNLISLVGSDIAVQILEGENFLKPNTNKVKIAQWVKGMLANLDKSVSESKRNEFMQLCGENCAKHNPRAVEGLKKKRQKYNSLEDFLISEEQNPQKGTKLRREGDSIIQIYTPKEFSHPMRCFCGLVNGLPENEILSKTYCQCSKALVQKVWENVIEKPVHVEVLETALTGSSECKFKITY